MTLQWVILLALVTTLIVAERKLYDESSNELLQWLDNSAKRFETWSPMDGEDVEQNEPEVSFKNENRKRALSFLSHWKPWKQISGNGRHVIRSPFSSFFPNSDSSQGGNRPVGQPLRWGRRRRR
ncbi:uncharacterized protein LOC126835946 [Adelges cooleyi]|uniref:uncharacterized protein LOC126835946 n=1 Tax=Adelges cooleyi TaxID=133065 RepID=UPI0021800C2A|nr:uncharacterized protein LOC126835946 [Adelges cooleyi]